MPEVVGLDVHLILHFDLQLIGEVALDVVEFDGENQRVLGKGSDGVEVLLLEIAFFANEGPTPDHHATLRLFLAADSHHVLVLQPLVLNAVNYLQLPLHQNEERVAFLIRLN